MAPEPSEEIVWLASGANPEIIAEMERIYADLQREIEARGPVCWASGRCCNFGRAGHRLYVTGVEAALTVRGLATLSQTADGGRVSLTKATLEDAIARDGCPFQRDNLCGVHPVRPLGCRVYFCDRSAQGWQQELYERALARVKAIHESHGVPYRYAEWRAMLGEILGAID